MLKSKKQKLQQEETQDKLVQTLSGKAAQKLPLNGTGGKPLKSQEEEAKRWKEYFSAVRLIVRTNNHSWLQQLACKHDFNEEEITVDEGTRAIKKLKNGKSAGIDGIQAGMRKYGRGEVILKLPQLCNKIWKTGEIPKDWRDVIIIPL